MSMVHVGGWVMLSLFFGMFWGWYSLGPLIIGSITNINHQHELTMIARYPLCMNQDKHTSLQLDYITNMFLRYELRASFTPTHICLHIIIYIYIFTTWLYHQRAGSTCRVYLNWIQKISLKVIIFPLLSFNWVVKPRCVLQRIILCFFGSMFFTWRSQAGDMYNPSRSLEKEVFITN